MDWTKTALAALATNAGPWEAGLLPVRTRSHNFRILDMRPTIYGARDSCEGA